MIRGVHRECVSVGVCPPTLRIAAAAAASPDDTAAATNFWTSLALVFTAAAQTVSMFAPTTEACHTLPHVHHGAANRAQQTISPHPPHGLAPAPPIPAAAQGE